MECGALFLALLPRGVWFWQEEKVRGRPLATQPGPAETSRAALMQSRREGDENMILGG